MGLDLTYFDIGGIIIILIFLFIGLSRGFLKELSKIICCLISLIGAKILSFPVENVAYKFLHIGEELNARITNVVGSVDFSSLESVRGTLSDGLASIPAVGPLLNNFVEENWNITEIVQKGSANIQSELVKLLMDSLEPIAHQILNIAVFIVLFIVLMIVSSIIFSLLTNIFTSLKIVGAVNALLGGLMGLIKGIVLVGILYSLLFIVLSMSSSEYLSVLMNSRFFDILLGIGKYLPS